MRKYIGTRLHPNRDWDIINALAKHDTASISKIIRKGVRLVLDLDNNPVKQVKQTQVNKKPSDKKPMVWKIPK